MRSVGGPIRKLAWLFLSLLLAAPTLPGVSLHAQDHPRDVEVRDRRGTERRAEEPIVDDGGKLAERDRLKDDNVAASDRLKSDNVKEKVDDPKSESAERVRQNNEAGRSWESKTQRSLEAQGYEPYREVTIESSGQTRSRADFLCKDPQHEGQYVLVESKASESAGFTKNQREVFGSVRAGDQVTVRGNGMGEGRNGERITISEIYVSRPDAQGNVRMEPYRETKTAGQRTGADAGKSP